MMNEIKDEYIFAVALPEVISLAHLREYPISENEFNWTGDSTYPLVYDSRGIEKRRIPKFDRAITPAVPTSSMFGASLSVSLNRIYKTIFLNDKVISNGNYKHLHIEECQRKLEQEFPDIMAILTKYGLEFIPEINMHLVHTLEVFRYLAEQYSITYSDEDIELLLLHDLAKPYALVYSHWKTTIDLLEDYGLDQLKSKIQDEEIDSRRLWRFADQLFESGKIIPPIDFTVFPEEVLSKDSLLLNWLIEEGKLDLSSETLVRLKKFNNRNYLSKSLMLVKLSELLSDYKEIVFLSGIDEALELKARAVAERYGAPLEEVKRKYLKLLEDINE